MSTLTARINTDNYEITFSDSETGRERKKWCVDYLEKNSHLIYKLIADEFFYSVSKLLDTSTSDDIDYLIGSSFVEMSPLKDKINNNIVFWYIIKFIIKTNPRIKINFSGQRSLFWSNIVKIFFNNNLTFSWSEYFGDYVQRFREFTKSIIFIFRHICYSIKYAGIATKMSYATYDVLILTPLTGLSTQTPLDSRYWNSKILNQINEDLSSRILVIGPANGISREDLMKVGKHIDYFLLDGVFNWRDLLLFGTLLKRLMSVRLFKPEWTIFGKICSNRITQYICGAEIISNSIISRRSRRLFSELCDESTKVVGLFENQGYEKIVYKYARLNGQETYGYCHTVVRMFDFRYSLSAALDRIIGSAYMPEYLLINGRLSLDAHAAINRLTPISSKVLEIPAFRFESLKTRKTLGNANSRKSYGRRKRRVGVILGITPMDRDLIKCLYKDMTKPQELYREYCFYVRPHPSLGLSPSETPEWVFDQSDSISEFVASLDICLISPTTASIYDVLIGSKVPVALLGVGGILPIDVELFGDKRFGVNVCRSGTDIERLSEIERPEVEYRMVFY